MFLFKHLFLLAPERSRVRRLRFNKCAVLHRHWFYASTVGTKCLNSGWGKDHNGIFAGLPDKLQVVELPIYERAECKQVYDGISPVMEGEVCAGTHGSGVSACSVSSIDHVCWLSYLS